MFVRIMFEHLFFIYLNCILRIIFVSIIIFLFFYYVVSLSYPCPSFLEFVVSPSCRIPVAVLLRKLKSVWKKPFYWIRKPIFEGKNDGMSDFISRMTKKMIPHF